MGLIYRHQESRSRGSVGRNKGEMRDRRVWEEKRMTTDQLVLYVR
jgi:hypothetical protein